MKHFFQSKLSKVLFISLIAVLLIGFVKVNSYAETTSEYENSPILTNGQWETGSLPYGTSYNLYQFFMPGPGYYTISFRPNKNADLSQIHDGWKFELKHPDALTQNFDYMPYIKTDYVTAHRSYPAGGLVYVKVYNTTSYTYSNTSGQPYDIKFDFYPDGHVEIENNNSAASANPVNVNEVYKGSTQESLGDPDWFTFTLPSAGKLQFAFDVDKSTDLTKIYDGWNLDLYDASKKQLMEINWLKTNTKLTELVLDKGTYYFCVSPQNAYKYQSPMDCWYNITPNFTALSKGWVKSNNEWYCVKADGSLANGWYKENNLWYYFKGNKMQTGWQTVDGMKYYFKPSGEMAKGWYKVDGTTWYYFRSDGAMATGLYKVVEENKWYYFDSYGKMCRANSWQWIDGIRYYFDGTGAMVIKDWRKVDGYWYYFSGTGEYVKNNFYKIDGAWYFFDSAGQMTKGWKYSDGSYYYFNPANGIMVTGSRTIDGKVYYFKATGECTNRFN